MMVRLVSCGVRECRRAGGRAGSNRSREWGRLRDKQEEEGGKHRTAYLLIG
jgi:hypothetical protein